MSFTPNQNDIIPSNNPPQITSSTQPSTAQAPNEPIAYMPSAVAMLEAPTNSSEEPVPSQPGPQMPNAGSCVLRLENLEQRSSAAKSELMHSIAEDISATFICIARHTEAGTLETNHTRVIDNVIKTIRDTDVERRIFLERKVRRLRKERHLLRKKHATAVGMADALARGYRNKVQGLTQLLREARGKVVQLRAERNLLLACVKKKGVEVNGAEGEIEVDTGDEAVKDAEVEGNSC